MPEKIVSGGQTGVDRAALDVAIELGISHGGWCPRGRLAEDGTIPARYQLAETESSQYAIRTERNVLDSDATLIVCRGSPRGGTRLTLRLAQQYNKPHWTVDLDAPHEIGAIQNWLDEYHVDTLNIAGPRESQSPGISHSARQFLEELLAADS